MTRISIPYNQATYSNRINNKKQILENIKPQLEANLSSLITKKMIAKNLISEEKLTDNDYMEILNSLHDSNKELHKLLDSIGIKIVSKYSWFSSQLATGKIEALKKYLETTSIKTDEILPFNDKIINKKFMYYNEGIVEVENVQNLNLQYIDSNNLSNQIYVLSKKLADLKLQKKVNDIITKRIGNGINYKNRQSRDNNSIATTKFSITSSTLDVNGEIAKVENIQNLDSQYIDLNKKNQNISQNGNFALPSHEKSQVNQIFANVNIRTKKQIANEKINNFKNKFPFYKTMSRVE